MKDTNSVDSGHGQKLSSIMLEETRQQQSTPTSPTTPTSPREVVSPAVQRNAYTKPVSYKIIVLGESGVGKQNCFFFYADLTVFFLMNTVITNVVADFISRLPSPYQIMRQKRKTRMLIYWDPPKLLLNPDRMPCSL